MVNKGTIQKNIPFLYSLLNIGAWPINQIQEKVQSLDLPNLKNFYLEICNIETFPPFIHKLFLSVICQICVK